MSPRGVPALLPSVHQNFLATFSYDPHVSSLRVCGQKHVRAGGSPRDPGSTATLVLLRRETRRGTPSCATSIYKNHLPSSSLPFGGTTPAMRGAGAMLARTVSRSISRGAVRAIFTTSLASPVRQAARTLRSPVGFQVARQMSSSSEIVAQQASQVPDPTTQLPGHPSTDSGQCVSFLCVAFDWSSRQRRCQLV